MSDERSVTYVKAGIGVMEVIIGFLLLASLDGQNKAQKRMDVIIESHAVEMERLEATARARNASFRLVADKLGIDKADVDDALADDLLAAEESKRRKKRP